MAMATANYHWILDQLVIFTTMWENKHLKYKLENLCSIFQNLSPDVICIATKWMVIMALHKEEKERETLATYQVNGDFDAIVAWALASPNSINNCSQF